MLSLIVLCAGLAASAAPAPDAPVARFLALGDSYTIGEGVAREERWPVLLAEALGKEGHPVGSPTIIARTGWTGDELAAAIDEANPVGPYELVSLMVGVNDQYRTRDPQVYRKELRRLLERSVTLAGGNPRRVVVLSIPDWGVTPFAARSGRKGISASIDAFNTVAREEAAKAKALWVDVTGISRRAREDPGLLAGDGLHPSPEMYREWVERVLPEALRALSE